MRIAVSALAICLLLAPVSLFPENLMAGEDDAGRLISGSLINGTTGGRLSGVEVVLQRYEREKEREKKKTISDSQGKFHFRNFDASEGNAYSLKVVYKGVEYYSSMIVFPDQKREIPFDMTVYDTTDSDEKISVVMHHVLVEPREEALWVRELMIVENRDKRVFVGAHEVAPDKKETLRISLPPRAQELQVLRGLMSCCIVQMEDGFADTMDIKPGRKEILFAYKIDYRSSSLTLSKKINLMTDSMDFFIPDQGIRATGENLQYAGVIGESGNQFLRFSGKKLAEGSEVALKLKGFPAGRAFFKKIAPILGVALMGLGLMYPLMRRRKKSNGTEVGPGQDSRGESGLQEQRQSLLQAIAELDDQLDAGQISPDEHEKRRRILKDRVIEIAQTLQDTDKPTKRLDPREQPGDTKHRDGR